ncbi:Xaa-His dipeptidase [Clostridium sp. CX1]|uniref:Xaa-His dipeptidase n=1 Tax=Clostridium sp. CX1 TaxID=2978346 RepID=UPI0021BF9449|nr:Xaa-His dipeptidase [Clostridium sp. CX1]MCT8978665.1 Xaa-His dipeptidase [Clostridium sp. CX1]
MKSVEDIINSNLNLIESMVEGNKTDKEIAAKLGISYSTFKRYKSSNDELKAVIAEGKDKKNQVVEQALYMNCIGYSYYEEVPTKVKEEVLAEDGTTILSKERVEVSSVKKYKGPDLAAQKYWLNNKEKTKWRDDPHGVDNAKKLTKLKEKEVEAKTSPI